jgi:hypothetical protein
LSGDYAGRDASADWFACRERDAIAHCGDGADSI